MLLLLGPVRLYLYVMKISAYLTSAAAAVTFLSGLLLPLEAHTAELLLFLLVPLECLLLLALLSVVVWRAKTQIRPLGLVTLLLGLFAAEAFVLWFLSGLFADLD